ncbi:MAG: hypothetical protein OER56_09325 [Hyphomicrobiales bacterium]|nr:hypothetical protein [Hyphomicrobiales bacterium]
MAAHRHSLLVLAIVCLSYQPAEAACTRWQADVTWNDDQGKQTHAGTGTDQPSALADARASCLKAAAPGAAKAVCRTGEPARTRYRCTDGRCIHTYIEDGLGWRANQGWSREAFCIDRGFDGVIRDRSDDQSGICYKGACG